MKFLTAGKRGRKRLSNHLFIIAVAFVSTFIIYGLMSRLYPNAEKETFCWSMATAYVAAILLAVTLTLGVWNALRGRVNAVSSDMRRDFGIWCGIFSLLHVAFGINVHMKSWTLYFVNEARNPRSDIFGVANYLGLAATIIVAVLLLTSNDFSLKHLKHKRWKAVQRWSYVLVFLTAAHGFVYQIIEGRLMPYGIILGVVMLWILCVQLAGFQTRRATARRQSGASLNG